MKTREERKAESQKALSLINEGDIFNYTWGYEQTNQDFYKIIKKSASCVWIKKLKVHEEDDGGFMTGISTPLNEYEPNAKEERKIPYLYNNEPHLNFKYGSCEKWDGEPARTSHYA